MYTLTLTSDERRAMDWIGDRYEHNNLYNLYKLLCVNSVKVFYIDGDIKFTIPENIAWQIKNLLQNGEFECCAESLVEKLVKFCEDVV